jgi:DNA processing protein
MKAKSARARQARKEPSLQEGPARLSESEKLAWLRLIRTPHIGVITFWELQSHFGSASAALEALPEFAKFGSRVTARTIPTVAAAEAELKRAAAAGMTLSAAREPGYPPLLSHIEAPPPLLYVKGQTAVWERPPVAVVGSRNASAAGLKFAAEISAELGRRGFLIVSGLARGIDGAAHRAALPFATCAVLPGGLDAIYPPEHRGLAAEITENGILVSECQPGFIARSQDFPRRNRIISGASLGVVVVEATERSGSLITARLAGEQNREVFAVPGHPFEPRSAGSNRLIKEGAVFTTSASDVEDALQTLLKAWVGKGPSHAEGLEAKRAAGAGCGESQSPLSQPAVDGFAFLGDAMSDVEKLLSLAPIDVDDLCRLSGLEARHVHAALVSLDLAGRVDRRGARLVALRP